VTAARPISAGTVRPDDRGAVTTFFPTAPDIPPPVAMAVTIEPDGGVPSPTGEKYLVGAAH
jgi:anti-sigma-K factor RskA